jgi:hypothetical protein
VGGWRAAAGPQLEDDDQEDCGLRHRSRCAAPPDRVSYGMIYHASATSLMTILRLECGDAPAGLDEHPEHGL